MAVLKCMLKHLSLKTCVEKDLMSYFGMCAHINLHQREYRKPGLCSAALHRVTAVYLSEYQHLCLCPCSWNALERDTRLAVALISIFSLSASRLAELCYFYPYWKKKTKPNVYIFLICSSVVKKLCGKVLLNSGGKSSLSSECLTHTTALHARQGNLWNLPGWLLSHFIAPYAESNAAEALGVVTEMWKRAPRISVVISADACVMLTDACSSQFLFCCMRFYGRKLSISGNKGLE